MPKRTHRQIRLDAMAEVRIKDAIRAQAKNRHTVVIKSKPTPVRKEKKKVCCLDKYGPNLPSYFRPCPDCFREPEMEQST